MSHSWQQQKTVHPHTVHFHTHTHTHFHGGAKQKSEGRCLLVPLGHLLTQSLDLSELGLCGDLCDAIYCDAFKKHCSLRRGGEGERKIEGWTWIRFKRPTLPRVQGKYFRNRRHFPNSCFFALWITGSRCNKSEIRLYLLCSAFEKKITSYFYLCNPRQTPPLQISDYIIQPMPDICCIDVFYDCTFTSLLISYSLHLTPLGHFPKWVPLAATS